MATITGMQPPMNGSVNCHDAIHSNTFHKLIARRYAGCALQQSHERHLHPLPFDGCGCSGSLTRCMTEIALVVAHCISLALAVVKPYAYCTPLRCCHQAAGADAVMACRSLRVLPFSAAVVHSALLAGRKPALSGALWFH
jgi:hypothetical protein